MADRESTEGPLVVWTFPLVTRIQNGNGILSLGSNVSTVSQKVGEIKESRPVKDKLTSGDKEDGGPDGAIEELQEQVDEIGDNSDSIFSEPKDYGQAETPNNEITIEDGTFVPIRLQIDQGEEVTWTNEDNQQHRVVSSSGEEISSEMLEPGEEFTHTFDSEGVNRFFDSVEGQSQMCGAVIVGDAQLEEDLPCEANPDIELFDEEDGDTDGDSEKRTMSSAVEDKEDMDMGF
jgi:plastocyanin